ncbi:MAG: hypothetical protein NVS2B7_27190 [Herpetosiphon sp.]
MEHGLNEDVGQRPGPRRWRIRSVRAGGRRMLPGLLIVLLAACSTAVPVTPAATGATSGVAATSAPAVVQTSVATAAGAAGTAIAELPTARSGGATATSLQAATQLPVATAPRVTAATQTSIAAASGAAGTLKQPVLITGTFTYTNDIITTYYVEHAVALVDLSNFVKRDLRRVIPTEGQTLGYMKLDEAQHRGIFNVELPAQPQATIVDAGHTAKAGAGVQIFTVVYWPNLTGGPFHEGDDKERGWPHFLASTTNDPENQQEVTGGKIVVYAPDNNQLFPTDFGPDGRLFTADDPVGPLPAGYSVIDLNQHPFGIIRELQPQMTLYEPKDVAIKDYAQLSYTEAYRKMFAYVRRAYAFNGVKGKEPAWDAVNARVEPQVAAAEQKQDPQAYYAALRDFVSGFNDGHVGLNGGQYAQKALQDRAGGGYGFAIRELDDGRFVVVFVTDNGPAAKAGIAVGDEITMFDSKPISDAIKAVQPLAGPFSTDIALRYQQARYVTRAPVGTQASITVKKSDNQTTAVTLTSVAERQSFQYTSLFRGVDPDALPVEFRVLPEGVGYVKVNSNYDDLNLIIRLFERAMKTFERDQLPGIVIDMRQNSGGADLGLAGFLTTKQIEMGQLEYYSDKTGKFEKEGVPDIVEANEHQYHFNKTALLVGQACYSACELESYAFSQVPGMLVIGQYGTAGVEAEVARGQFKLPAGMSLQVPTGRFVKPDGSIFLEGKGVVPTQRVPVDATTVLSKDDMVLKAAVTAVGGQ